ncbi:MAG: hypothetical protein ABIP34_11680 [Rhodoferax sp.]
MNRLSIQTIAVLCLVSLAGCATSLDTGAEKVQVVTAAQKERLCQSLGVIGTEQRLGPNKPSNAMHKALNEVASKGGNGIFVISSNLDWAEGASVTAEALKCKF